MQLELEGSWTRLTVLRFVYDFGYWKLYVFALSSKLNFLGNCPPTPPLSNLRASSPIWASEASLVSLLSSAPRSRVLARLTSLAQIGELPRRLSLKQTLTLTSHLGQNICLRKGQVGCFPETSLDPYFRRNGQYCQSAARHWAQLKLNWFSFPVSVF